MSQTNIPYTGLETPLMQQATTWRARAADRLRNLLVPCLSLAACVAVTPLHAQPAPTAADAACRSFEAEQGGAVVRPADGTLTLARQPFTLRVLQDGSSPGLHVATQARLASALQTAGSREIWLSAGDAIAGDTGALFAQAEFRLFASDARQSAFAAAFGPRNVARLGPGAATHAVPPLAGEIPRNTWFEPAKDAGIHVLQVRTIDQTPVERTTMPALHLVAFTSLQSHPSAQAPMFHRSTWSACAVQFGR